MGQQLRTAHQVTYLVADSALSTAENLAHLEQRGVQWLPRVPATLSEVPALLAEVTPATMAPLTEGYRYHERPSTYGGVTQRWIVVSSEARQERGHRTVDKQVHTQSEAALQVLKRLCRTAFACSAEARQALETCKHGLQATRVAGETIRTVTRYGKRGRPTPGAVPTASRIHDRGSPRLLPRLPPDAAGGQELFSPRDECTGYHSTPSTRGVSGGQKTVRRRAGFAASRTRSSSRRRCLSKSRSALWRS